MPGSGNDLHPKIRCTPVKLNREKPKNDGKGSDDPASFWVDGIYILRVELCIFRGVETLDSQLFLKSFQSSHWPSVRYDTNNDVSIPPPHEM